MDAVQLPRAVLGVYRKVREASQPDFLELLYHNLEQKFVRTFVLFRIKEFSSG